MIYVNAIWIAVDIEFNKADMVMQAEYPFLIAEIVFTLYFSGELFVRFMSYEKRKRALKDSWFIFDLLLVAMMLLETWVIPLTAFIVEGGFQPPADDGANISRSASVLRIARIMRVFRTARIIRVARYMPELMILIKGVLPDPSELFLKGGKTVLFINSNICWLMKSFRVAGSFAWCCFGVVVVVGVIAVKICELVFYRVFIWYTNILLSSLLFLWLWLMTMSLSIVINPFQIIDVDVVCCS